MVRVDQSGEDRTVRAVDDPVRGPPDLADRRDPAPLDQDIAEDDLAAGILRHDVSAAEKEGHRARAEGRGGEIDCGGGLRRRALVAHDGPSGGDCGPRRSDSTRAGRDVRGRRGGPGRPASRDGGVPDPPRIPCGGGAPGAGGPSPPPGPPCGGAFWTGEGARLSWTGGRAPT